MKRIPGLALAGVGCAALLALAWFISTPGGRTWRLSRATTAELQARTLSRPDDTETQRVLGERLLAEGRAEEAAVVYAAAAATLPDAAWPLLAQGRALIQAGLAGEALAPLEEALERAPEDADALAALGEAYYELGNRAQAEQWFAQARRHDSSNASALAGSAFVLADRHNLAQARAAAEKAVHRAPKSGRAQMALGYVEDEAGNRGRALRALQRAAELAPRDGRVWQLLGAVLTRTARTAEDFARAADALSRAETLLPRSPRLPYYRGLLLERQQDYAGAVNQFRRALERNPNATDVLFRLSAALAHLGRTAESAGVRAQFERARNYEREMMTLQVRLGRDPGSAALWRRMRIAAEAHGDESRARLARLRLQALQSGESAEQAGLRPAR